MAQINGSVSNLPTKFAYYIIWNESNVNIPNNTSDVTASVYVQKVGDYNVQSVHNDHWLYIDGTGYFYNNAVDMNPETTPQLLSTGTKTITHNADGSKSITISASGEICDSLTYGPISGSASASVTLTTIPRAASITSSADLTIGNNLAYTLKNDGGLYVKLQLHIWNGSSYSLVFDSNRGTGASGTVTLGTTENNIMYAAMPSNTSRSCILRAYTYSDSGYSVQVGSYYDVSGTIYVNQTTNKPTFTTYTVGNLDKSIANTDKYSNVLVTSSTSTLLGADTKMIKGYSKLRAVITSANKMVALNYATAVKYRFIVGSAYNEQNYSASSTVNLDVDNATTNSVSVTAYDSRSLTTTVANSSSITYVANYVPVSLWGITLTRDNGVDDGTKLAFNGSYWKEYFGGGTSGIQNTITAHYRYKETTASWGAQTWTAITLTDTDGALSFDDYINGDLGASGFDTEKSFNIEVRIYDKLTNYIIEGTLNVGTPVIDITRWGISLLGKYNSGSGGALQLYAENIETGWIPSDEAWSYSNSTTITIPAGGVTRYEKGDKVRLTQDSTTKYFYITSVADTTITVTGGSDYSVANSPISVPCTSKAISPEGFPDWFNWSPSKSGITVGNGSLITRFSVKGRTVNFFIRFELGSTSAITGRNYFSLPVAGAGYGTGLVFIQDTGWETFQGQAFWNTDNVFVDVIGSDATYAKQLYFSSTVPMTWVSTDWYVTSGSYEMYNT